MVLLLLAFLAGAVHWLTTRKGTLSGADVREACGEGAVWALVALMLLYFAGMLVGIVLSLQS